jgi:hypothetical protein
MKFSVKPPRKVKVRKMLPSNLTCGRIESPRNGYRRRDKFRKNFLDESGAN